MFGRLTRMAWSSTALVAGIALAAPAYADPGTVSDDNFLTALKSAGITYRNEYQAVAAAQAVCGLMDNGASGIDVISDVQKSNPGFTLDGAGKFAAIAANEYCPQHLERPNG